MATDPSLLNDEATLTHLYGRPVLPWETDFSTLDEIRNQEIVPINPTAAFQARRLHPSRVPRQPARIPPPPRRLTMVVTPTPESKAKINIPPPPPRSPRNIPPPPSPKVQPKPASPKVQPKPASPKVQPKPASPKVQPKPASPKVQPKPASPKVIKSPRTSVAMPKPLVMAPMAPATSMVPSTSSNVLRPLRPPSKPIAYISVLDSGSNVTDTKRSPPAGGRINLPVVNTRMVKPSKIVKRPAPIGAPVADTSYQGEAPVPGSNDYILDILREIDPVILRGSTIKKGYTLEQLRIVVERLGKTASGKNKADLVKDIEKVRTEMGLT